VHRYLVVANQTLGGQELVSTIRDRMARGPAEFWVLTPATPPARLVTNIGAISDAFPVAGSRIGQTRACTQRVLYGRPRMPNSTCACRKSLELTSPPPWSAGTA
jgi:hypothetical protein